MTVVLHVTLEVTGAGLPRFLKAMGEAVPILEGLGWRLTGAYTQRTGRLNTVIDVWELDDFDHYDRGIQGFVKHPRFPAIKSVLDETVVNEVVVFASKAPYMH